MKYLSMLISIGLLFLCFNYSYANDCDGSGDCGVYNICLKVDLSECSDSLNYSFSKTSIIHSQIYLKIPPLQISCSGSGYTILQFQMDWDDGIGWRNMPFSTNVNGSGTLFLQNYTTGGVKNVKLRIQAQNNNNGLVKWITHKYKNTKAIKFNENPHNTVGQYDYQSPDTVWNIVSDVYTPTCTGVYPTDINHTNYKYNLAYAGEGNAYIKYANPDHIIRKPVILVEGIDFGEDIECDPSTGQIIRYGDLGWDMFTLGMLESRGTQQLQEMSIQIDSLSQTGHDVIIVDFKDGTDYIQRNAQVLISIIEQLNQVKDCGAEETIVIGASMGGQIARFALTLMEQEGTPHEVRTYVSFDSPHQGANVPLSLQATIWLGHHAMGDSLIEPELKDFWEIMIAPATQQLMYDNFLNAWQQGKLIFRADGVPINLGSEDPYAFLDYACLRSTFISERTALGYPQYCRNVAIVNGSRIAIPQSFNAGDSLVNINFKADAPLLGVAGIPSSAQFYGALFALNGDPNTNNIVDMQLKIKTGIITLVSEHYEVETQQAFPAYDNAPGCYQNFIGGVMTGYGINNYEKNAYRLGHGYAITLNTIGFNTFMPTISTLDVNTNDLLYDIHHADQNGYLQTPFDDYYAPNANEQHVEITAANRAWTNTEISKNTNQLNGITIGSGYTYQTYNFGGLRKFINNFTVANGGIVYLNEHSLSLGFNGSTALAPTGQLEAHTGRCSVTIENGGVLNIGGVYQSDKATLRVVSGSTLHIKSGGIVRIKGYSQVIIEEGATLIIEDGGMINYWGTGTGNAPTLRIEGILVVQNNGNTIAELTGHGRMQVTETATVDIQDNAHLRLDGSDKAETMLELAYHVDFGVDGDARLTLVDGKVEYADYATIIANNDGFLAMSEVTLAGNNGYTAIEADNPSHVILDKVDFEDLDMGLYLQNGATNASVNYMVTNSNFTNCAIGIQVENTTSFKSVSNVFDGNNGGANAFFVSNTEVLTLSSNTIQNYTAYAIFLDDVPVCQLRNSLINNCTYGVYGQNKSNVFLSSQTIMSNNTTAIHLIGDAEDGMVSMNCAVLDNNVTGISGTDVLLDIDAEVHAFNSAYISPNVFKNINPNGYLFDICYFERNVANIYAKSNYWDGMTSLSPSQYHLNRNLGGSSCPNFSNVSLDISNAYTTEPTGCNYENPNGVPTLPVGSGTTSTSAVQMVANQCVINTNNQSYDVATQYKMGDEKFKEEEFEDADLKYAPVSALSGTTRDNSGTSCRHYIDVAEVMVKVEEILRTQKSSRNSGITNINDLWDESVISTSTNQRTIDLSAYPNPATDILTIKIMDDVVSKGEVKLYNSLGQVVYTSFTYDQIITIPVNTLASGLYRVTFVSEDDHVMGEMKVMVE